MGRLQEFTGLEWQGVGLVFLLKNADTDVLFG